MLVVYKLFSGLCGPSKLQHLLVALEELGLGLEKALHDTLHNLPRLVLELVLGWAENLLKHANELGREALDSGLVGFVYGALLASCHCTTRE